MKRLTTDTPNNNFETAMNFVRGGGWATIRAVGYEENVLLTDWAKAQCIAHGCDEFPGTTAEEIDETICDCIMDEGTCPIALAYAFATQAVHLRDRLKAIEDVLGDDYDLIRIHALVQAERDRRLVVSPCKADIVYTIEEDYFNCSICQHGSKAYFHDEFRKVYCDIPDVSCPHYIKSHNVKEFERLEEIMGCDEQVYYTREDAEAAREAIKKTEDVTPPSEPQL